MNKSLCAALISLLAITIPIATTLSYALNLEHGIRLGLSLVLAFEWLALTMLILNVEKQPGGQNENHNIHL